MFNSKITVLLAVALVTSACSSKKLDKETAKQLLDAKYADTPAECRWNGPNRASDKQWIFNRNNHEKCGEALAAAGLVVLGDRFDDFSREFFPGKGVRMGDRGYMDIPCGTLRVDEVVSITTEEGVGNNAEVKFKRTFVPDEKVLKSISACTLSKPEAGTVERQWKATRDDDGKWSISDAK